MGPRTPAPEGDFFRQPLREQINLQSSILHPARIDSHILFKSQLSGTFYLPIIEFPGRRELSIIYLIFDDD
jgi:hypothetical protein